MTKFPKALLAIFALGAMSLGCGLTDLAADIFSRLPNPPPLTLYVSKTGYDANDCLSEATACLTIRAALDKSTPTSTIHIGRGEFLEGRGNNLNNGVTLVGAGSDPSAPDFTTLRSLRDVYVLVVGGWRPVVIRNLAIMGTSAADGGINVISGANATLEDCRVFSSAVGIQIQRDGVATINHCVIKGNQQGVLIHAGGVATINNDSVIEANIITGVSNEGTATIDHSVITGNTTGVSNDGTATINNASVIEENDIGIVNRGGLRGGVRGGGLTMDNTTLQHNAETAIDNRELGIATITGSTFDSNGSPGGPSVRYSPTISNAGEMHIDTSTISHNDGIAVRNDVAPYFISAFGETYSPSDRRPDLSLDHVQIFENNSWDGRECAIANMKGRIAVYASNIHNNRCIGVDVYGGRVEISQSSIIDNHLGMFARGESSVHVENTTISGNGDFGIEQVDSARLELVFVTVANQATGLSSSFAPPANLVVVDSVILGCNAAVVDRGEFVCNDSWTEYNLGLGPLTEASTWVLPTWVHPLLAGSPLIDAALSCPSGSSDQRNYSRPKGSTCDVGAYEDDSSSRSGYAPLVYVTPSGGVPGVIPLYTDTPTPTPTATATPGSQGKPNMTLTLNANCRKGPGSVYPVLTSVNAGQVVQVLGRNAASTWWYSLIPGNHKCWISISAGSPEGDIRLIVVLADPPTPVPTSNEPGVIDFDKDGYPSDKDCNDKDAKIHPGAAETFNDKVDSNCNGDDNK